LIHTPDALYPVFLFTINMTEGAQRHLHASVINVKKNLRV